MNTYGKYVHLFIRGFRMNKKTFFHLTYKKKSNQQSVISRGGRNYVRQIKFQVQPSKFLKSTMSQTVTHMWLLLQILPTQNSTKLKIMEKERLIFLKKRNCFVDFFLKFLTGQFARRIRGQFTNCWFFECTMSQIAGLHVWL